MESALLFIQKFSLAPKDMHMYAPKKGSCINVFIIITNKEFLQMWSLSRPGMITVINKWS